MQKFFFQLLFLGMLMFLLGSSNVKVEEYRNNSPILQIQQYLNGDIEAHGILQDWRGVVTRRFSAKINGRWKENQGILEEKFIFDDGDVQTRTWTINFSDHSHFTATAGDVVGMAQGKQSGNSLNMRYILRIPYKSKDINIDMDDWMYLINDSIMINKTKMTKFGFNVGNLTIIFLKNL